MPKPAKSHSQSKNPFYMLLVVVGVLFVLTACAYCLMALREADPRSAGQPHGLIGFMDRYGFITLAIEIVLLTVATVGAMLTDDYWDRRARRRAAEEDERQSS